MNGADMLTDKTLNIMKWCDSIHEIVHNATFGVNLFLDKIDAANDRNWSPTALLPIHLENDARTLVELAARMRKTRRRLISHGVGR